MILFAVPVAKLTSLSLELAAGLGGAFVLISQLAIVTGLPHEDGAAGFDVTINESVAKLPVSVEVLMNKFPDVLLYVAAVEAVTVAVTVQVLLPATVPPVSAIGPVVPEVPIIVPPHCGVVTLAESVRPPGRVSEKATPVNAAGPGLFIVNVSVEVPPGWIVFGANDLVMPALTI